MISINLEAYYIIKIKEVRTICTKPLIRAETHERYTNKKGGTSYKVEWLQRDIWDRRKENHKFLAKYRRVQEIPCGQCIECRLKYSREWATRCMLELKYWNPNTCWFLTLTYDDEHLRFHETVNTETGEIETGQSLYLKDMQDFWKRVRKHYKVKGMKYITAGEYGSETMRPHYHAIVYGLPLNIHDMKRIGLNSQGDAYYQNEELSKIWGKGFVTIGKVTWQSAAYVARYSLKKAKGSSPEMLKAMGKTPEFVTMSQGIGKRYFEENKEQIYKSDTVPVLNTKTGQLVKPPKSYDRLLKEVDERLYNSIKKEREKSRETQEELIQMQTDLNAEERRNQKEEVIKKQFKDIRREM